MKLTEEQAKIVEDNYKLIGAFIRDMKLDYDEWHGILAIELCEAVKLLDEDKGKLSTLFYNRAKNKIVDVYRMDNGQKRDGGYIYSLDYEYQDENGETFTFGETIEDSSFDVSEEVIMNIVKNNMLSEKMGAVVKLRLYGYNQMEISQLTGYSQAYISSIIQDFKSNYFGEENDT